MFVALDRRACGAGDRGSAGDLLPTTVVAASAQRTAGLDDHVADLRREPVRAAEQLPVEDDPSADAGADADVQDVAVAVRGPDPDLAPDGGGVVVLRERRNPERALDAIDERCLAPREVRREPQDPRAGLDHARGRD